MAAILRDSTVVAAAAVVGTRPRAIPLAMITMRKSTHGFPFVSHIWVGYGAPLGGPLGRRSSAMKSIIAELVRAKRASKAPWVIKIGNQSSRENLVMTSVYERTNAVRTDSGGGGGASRGKPHRRCKECHLFWARFVTKNSFIFVMNEKTFNSRKGQRTNQKYRNLVGSDQQMRRLA